MVEEELASRMDERSLSDVLVHVFGPGGVLVNQLMYDKHQNHEGLQRQVELRSISAYEALTSAG